MKKKKYIKSDGNIIFFPKLEEKLITNGMEALKGKKYKEANDYFLQLIEINPEHPQGNIGLVLSLIELGRLEDAKKRAERLLKKGIGDYYDVVQIYISVLIQLSDYDEVGQLIEAIREEGNIPPELEDNFNQILNFSNKMKLSKLDEETSYHDNSDIVINITKLLNSSNKEQKWEAIQLLQSIETPTVLPILEEFLLHKDNDPLIKTALLQVIRDKQLASTIQIHKFDEVITVNIGQLEDPFYQAFNQKVSHMVAEYLEQENPSLYEMVKQLWYNYLLAIYPITPQPKDEQLWCISLIKAGHDLNGLEYNYHTLYEGINLKEEEVKKCVSKIIEIETTLSSDTPPFA